MSSWDVNIKETITVFLHWEKMFLSVHTCYSNDKKKCSGVEQHLVSLIQIWHLKSKKDIFGELFWAFFVCLLSRPIHKALCRKFKVW